MAEDNALRILNGMMECTGRQDDKRFDSKGRKSQLWYSRNILIRYFSLREYFHSSVVTGYGFAQGVFDFYGKHGKKKPETAGGLTSKAQRNRLHCLATSKGRQLQEHFHAALRRFPAGGISGGVPRSSRGDRFWLLNIFMRSMVSIPL